MTNEMLTKMGTIDMEIEAAFRMGFSDDEVDPETPAELAATDERILDANPTLRIAHTLEKRGEIAKGRTACERTLANLQKRERAAGLTLTPTRSFKGLDPAALKAAEGEMLTKLRELTAPEKAARDEAKAAEAVKAETERLAAEEMRKDHECFVKCYRIRLEELRRIDPTEASRLYHPEPSRISLKNLMALHDYVIDTTFAIESAREQARLDAEAKAEANRVAAEKRAADAARERELAKKRAAHELDQKRLADHAHARLTGRTFDPYGVWVKRQPTLRHVRRAG